MGELQDRVAIVTGASGGIGKAIAIAFAAAGATVMLAARSAEKLEAIRDEIKQRGGNAVAVPTDVTSEADVRSLFHMSVARFGKIDILVNNAGVSTRLPTDELPLEEFQRVIAINVTGVFLCSREALRVMKPRREGRIINIGSVAAKAPRPDAIAYSTSKSALEGLTRSLAIDARDHGVTASLIQPGNTRSQLWTEQRAPMAAREGLMEAGNVARVAVMIASMPADVNVYETVVHPIRMPWMGRG